MHPKTQVSVIGMSVSSQVTDMPRFAPTRTLLAAAALALPRWRRIAGETLKEARNDLTGAKMDLADATSYLKELKAGHFEGIYSMDGDTLRCGEVASNPDCAPLTDADKQQAVAEAEEMVMNATALLHQHDRGRAAGRQGPERLLEQ